MRWFVQTLLRLLDALLPEPDEPEHIKTGRRGEELAYFHLRKHKYTIVARNFRTPWHKSELDLIGWDRQTLCFIEVKTRTTRDVATAEAAVDEAKRDDLRRVGRHYLRQCAEHTATRFDIVTVYLDHPSPEITILKNAFQLSGE